MKGTGFKWQVALSLMLRIEALHQMARLGCKI